jgi:prepilin-type processing-associated H-X9-DG protein
LIVVAIISLLAAILFPVFARVRESGRRAACISNMKQIGLGILQYAQDYDEQLPRLYYAPDAWSSKQSVIDNDASRTDCANLGQYKWMDAIYPYVKSEQVFNCPSLKYTKNAGPYRYCDSGPISSPNGDKYGSYVANALYTSDNNPGYRPPFNFKSTSVGIKLSDIALPATTIFIAEGTGGTPWFSANLNNNVIIHSDADPQYLASATGTDTHARMVERHLATMNTLYGDGHVKAQKLQSLVSNSRTVGSSKVFNDFTINDD